MTCTVQRHFRLNYVTAYTALVECSLCSAPRYSVSLVTCSALHRARADADSTMPFSTTSLSRDSRLRQNSAPGSAMQARRAELHRTVLMRLSGDCVESAQLICLQKYRGG